MTIIDDAITHTIDQLIPDPNNVRHDDTDGIDELLASILNRGLIQPITIRPDGVIVAGHRRRSAIKLGIETGRLPASYPIPVYVKLDATDDTRAGRKEHPVAKARRENHERMRGLAEPASAGEGGAR